jgi:probable HAF family extracellular repeat protein
VKTLNGNVVVAMFALLFSGSAMSQEFTPVAVPGTNPDTVIVVNNDGVVIVNNGAGDSAEVSLWSRANGSVTLGLSGSNNSAGAINSASAVVGAGNPTGSSDLRGFVWQPAGGQQWLGSLGGGLSAASGINDSGAVVGLSYTGAHVQHAFLWTAAGGMQDLTPNLTGAGGAATAINSANQVVGYYFPNGSQNTLGFVWTQAGGIQSLGGAGTLALAINDAGMVVGQAPIASGLRHAFSWTQSGGITDLGTLGGGESSAMSVNSMGWVVGTSLTTNKNEKLKGFLWNSLKGIQLLDKLGNMAANDQQTYSVQLNDAGVIAMSTNKGGYILIPSMTVSLKSSLNPSLSGETVTFTATITSVVGAPPDGETVQFTVNGKAAGSASLSGGVAKLTTSSLQVGDDTIVATYVGDANYLATNSKTLTQVVQQ